MLTFQKRKKRTKPEDATVKAGLRWLALQHPNLRKLIVKIDNEGKRSIAGHKNAIECGLHVGASDLLLPYPTATHAGLWIEVKPDDWVKPRNTKEKERVEKQLNFGALMRLHGYEFKFARGTDELIKAFQDYIDEDKKN